MEKEIKENKEQVEKKEEDTNPDSQEGYSSFMKFSSSEEDLICRCPSEQICVCNAQMILDALTEYNTIYDDKFREYSYRKLKPDASFEKLTEEFAEKPLKSEFEKKVEEFWSKRIITCQCEKNKICICEDHMVSIRFFMKNKHIFSKKYSYRTSIKQLKYEMSNILQIPIECIQILRWHVYINEDKILEHLENLSNELDLTVVNTSSIVPPLLEDDIETDIITVHIENENEIKDITVTIEDRKIKKPFMGGYNHIQSGVEYHHACTQSGPPRSIVEPQDKKHRDTQTKYLKHRYIDQSYEHATQMSNERTFIPTVTDKIIIAKRYETAEERECRLDIVGKVRVIQRYYWRWKLKKALKILREEYHQRIQNQIDENKETEEEFKTLKIQEVNAKIFPRTRDDFGMLYSMVDRWKKAQTDHICKNMSGAAKLAELYLLLNKEIKMLEAIEKHRQRVKKKMKEIEVMRFFKFISDPVRWKGYKGVDIEMDTLETQKGREFKNTYYELSNHKQTREERLQVLRNIIDSFKGHSCFTSNRMIDLLRREEQMLLNNVDESTLDMLRKRSELLLLKHMKLPECNHGVTRRLNTRAHKEYEGNSNYCGRCSKIKPNKDFPPINSRNLTIKSCMSCTWYDRVKEPWFEVAPYRLMLRQLQRDERKRDNLISVAYIIQEKDIHYIVQRIWHARSAISESTDLNSLRLCRWKRDEQWSPWNTILLTDKERECHLKIPDLEKVYDEVLRTAVLDKNLLGRVIFANTLFLNSKFETEASSVAQPDTEETEEKCDFDASKDFVFETKTFDELLVNNNANFK